MTAGAQDARGGRGRWPAWSVVAIVVAASTVLPRLAVIGGPPETDEGVYAFFAQLIHHSLASGRGLPDHGPLMLYPLLVSWVFHFSANPFILLRLCDLAVAAGAAALLCVILQRESGDRYVGAVIAFIFLWAMNQPGFNQSGFRNPIFCAYIPLFSAFLLVQFLPEDPVHWYLAGALTAVAVLLREPFVVLAAAASIFALRVRPRDGLRFILGGVAVGAGGIGVFCLLRGSIGGLTDGYVTAAKVYHSVGQASVRLFLKNGAMAAYYAVPALLLGATGAVQAFRAAAVPGAADSRGRLQFWLVVTLLPLWEPMAKLGLTYHFAQCLPGLAGLTAFGWRHADQAARARNLGPRAIAGAVVALILALNAVTLAQQWPSSMRALLAMGSGTWPTQTIAHSNLLQAAAAIRRIAPANATLSVAEFQIGLYPLTGLLPPDYRLESLNIAAIELGQSEPRLQALLASCPPDIVIATVPNIPNAPIPTAAVMASGLYRVAARLPSVKDVHHSPFSIIYARTGTRPVSCVGG